MSAAPRAGRTDLGRAGISQPLGKRPGAGGCDRHRSAGPAQHGDLCQGAGLARRMPVPDPRPADPGHRLGPVHPLRPAARLSPGPARDRRRALGNRAGPRGAALPHRLRCRHPLGRLGTAGPRQAVGVPAGRNHHGPARRIPRCAHRFADHPGSRRLGRGHGQHAPQLPGQPGGVPCHRGHGPGRRRRHEPEHRPVARPAFPPICRGRWPIRC